MSREQSDTATDPWAAVLPPLDVRPDEVRWKLPYDDIVAYVGTVASGKSHLLGLHAARFLNSTFNPGEQVDDLSTVKLPAGMTPTVSPHRPYTVGYGVLDILPAYPYMMQQVLRDRQGRHYIPQYPGKRLNDMYRPPTDEDQGFIPPFIVTDQELVRRAFHAYFRDANRLPRNGKVHLMDWGIGANMIGGQYPDHPARDIDLSGTMFDRMFAHSRELRQFITRVRAVYHVRTNKALNQFRKDNETQAVLAGQVSSYKDPALEMVIGKDDFLRRLALRFNRVVTVEHNATLASVLGSGLGTIYSAIFGTFQSIASRRLQGLYPYSYIDSPTEVMLHRWRGRCILSAAGVMWDERGMPSHKLPFDR